MVTQAELEEQLAKLRSHRASGIRTVQHGDDRVDYKTDAEMAMAVADLERRIAALTGGRATTVHIHSSKGI